MSKKSKEYLKAESSGPLKNADLDKVRAMQFGGTTNIWTSGNVQYDEIDFMDRPKLNIDGWPIEFNEIKSYYHRAKSYVKIGDSKFKKDSKSNNLSKSFLNNPYFVQRNQIRRKAGSNFNKMYYGDLKKSKNIVVFLKSILTNISLSNNNVDSVEVSSWTNEKKKIYGTKIILCCGGFENTRLLLNFNRLNKINIGNRKNALGRYYSTHINLYNGILITDNYLNNVYNNLNSRVHELIFLSFKKRILLKKNLLNLKILFQDFNFDDSLPNLYKEVSSILGSHSSKLKAYRLNTQFENTPCYSSEIKLTNSKGSLNNLFKAELNYDINESDIEIYNKMYKIMGLGFGISGRFKFYHENVYDLIYNQVIGGSHHIGTTRIETKKYGGSVDKNLKVIDTNNLYCVSSSCFPTPSHANPTFTIIALAIKLSDHLKKIL